MAILPNADKAIVPIEKLRDYSLNSSYDRGKHKARVFVSALGMTQEDAPRLRDMILQAVLTNEAVEIETNEDGNSLRGGEVGTVVDRWKDGTFEVEFSDDTGEPYAFVALKAEKLFPLYYRQKEAA